jgi:N-acylethanolamine-hydrolysing acid amidase
MNLGAETATTMEANIPIHNPIKPKEYIVHLDGDPQHMWDQVCRDYKEKILNVEKHIDEMVNKGTLSLGLFKSITISFGVLARFNMITFSQELRGISRELGIHVGKVVALQLVYEASTCCTSIVVDNGINLMLARTMDWDMPSLKDLTIDIDFRMRGKTVFKATSWAGYVGILTGVSNRGFAVSVNYRSTNSNTFWNNVKELVLYSWPIGYLVRHTLSQAVDLFEAVEFLRKNPIIAPCFITIAGKYSGFVLSRDTRRVLNSQTIHTTRSESVESIVQTNNDVCDNNVDHNLPFSNERRKLVQDTFSKIKKNQVNEEFLWKLMSTHPILNSETVYGTIMNPETCSCETRISDNTRGFL